MSSKIKHLSPYCALTDRFGKEATRLAAKVQRALLERTEFTGKEAMELLGICSGTYYKYLNASEIESIRCTKEEIEAMKKDGRLKPAAHWAKTISAEDVLMLLKCVQKKELMVAAEIFEFSEKEDSVAGKLLAEAFTDDKGMFDDKARQRWSRRKATISKPRRQPAEVITLRRKS